MAAAILMTVAAFGSAWAAAAPETKDRDADGRPDSWKWRDEKGKVLRSATDTNGDGKADRFELRVKGPVLVLKEFDKNFDGKIDVRSFCERSFDNKTYIWRYRPVWKETDADFDGVIDLFKQRAGVKLPDRTSQPMRPEVTESITPEPGQKKSNPFDVRDVVERRGAFESEMGPAKEPKKESK